MGKGGSQRNGRMKTQLLLLALKMEEEGARCQGIQMASRSGERQNRHSPCASRQNTALWLLDFSLARPVFAFWSTQLYVA